MKNIIQRFSIKNATQITSLCKPLLDSFSIPYFTYYKVKSDGNFCILSNFFTQCDYYYSEKLYLSNPYIVHPDLIHSGSVFTATTPDCDYLKTVQESREKFKLNNTFLMVAKSEKQVEGFLFGMSQDDPNCVHHYMQNFDLLKKFNRYFVTSMKPLIKKIEDEGYNMKEDKGIKFLERDCKLPLSINKNTENFAKQIALLSIQEQKCLELFQQGHSAQSTAITMGLSRRTVEHYFESIKNKLNCYSKWDLLK